MPRCQPPDPAEMQSLLLAHRLVAVLRLPSAEEALAAGRAVLEGGARIVEVTLTTPGALEVMQALREEAPTGAAIGAGTVTTPDELSSVVDAGAAFAISPDVCLEVIRAAAEHRVFHVPGALTATEVLAAARAGARAVKIFPVASAGGAKHVQALRGPIPAVPFLVSGGVDLATLEEFFTAGADAVGLAGTLVLPELTRARDFEGIAELTRAYLTRLAAIPGR